MPGQLNLEVPVAGPVVRSVHVDNYAAIQAGVNELKTLTFNVKDYGAKGDGTTDDTAAIQTALNDAVNTHGTVKLPATTGFYQFSNLTMHANTALVGDGMNASYLRRIVGSTGTALREKTVAEGNPYGAVAIQLRDFQIVGASTSGDGIDLGRQTVGMKFTSKASMQNIACSGFPSGTGITVRSDATTSHNLWSHNNLNGFSFDAGAANAWVGLFTEACSGNHILCGDVWSSLVGMDIEEDTVSSANSMVKITAGGNCLTGLHLKHAGATAKTYLCEITAANVMVRDVNVSGVGTYTHTVGNSVWSHGTGVQAFVAEYFYGTGATAQKWYENSATGTLTQHN